MTTVTAEDDRLQPGAYVVIADRLCERLCELRAVSDSGYALLVDCSTDAAFSVPLWSARAWRLVRPAPTVGDTLEDELARCAA